MRPLRTLCAMLAASAALTACGLAGRIVDGHLDIEPAELQERIARRFPVQNCKLVIACLDLSNPQVQLTDGSDRIGLTTDVKVTLGNRERTGHLAFNGRPRYAQEQGQLFLDDVQITTLELAGLPPEYADLVKNRGAAEARRALQQHPIYTLDTRTAKGAFARQAVRDVKVVNGKLRVEFANAGERSG